MLSGKVIKGINAGNVAFHHRTMQIIARQQTICWQWPFFLSLRDTGVSTLANAAVHEQRVYGGKQLMGLGFMFRLCIIQPLDVDECSSGIGWLQDPSCRRSPRSAPHKRHLEGAALTACLRQEGEIPWFPSQALSYPKGRREGKFSCLQSQPCPALQCPAVTARSSLWRSAASQLCLAHPGEGKPSAWSHIQPHVPLISHNEHFWGHFRGSQWMS